MKNLKSENTSKYNDYESEQLQAFSLFLFVWIFFWFAALFVIFWRGQIYEQPHPLDTFFPGPVTRGGDLFLLWDRWQFEGFSKSGAAHLYFPLAYLPIHLLVNFNPWNALFIFYASVLLPLLFIISKFLSSKSIGKLNQANITFVLLCNYPILFMLHTGNLEGLVFLFIFLSFIFSLNNRDSAAAFAIGLAIAFKGIPILMLPFLFNGRAVSTRWQILKISAGTAVFSTLFSMFVLPYGRNVRLVLHNTIESQKIYNEMMVFGQSGIYFGHSFLNGIHAVFGLSVMNSNLWVLLVAFCGMTLLGVVTIFNHRHTITSWKFAALLACISCFFTPTSTDYKLMYFLPAIAMFCTKKGKLNLLEKFSAVILALIISPKPWFVLPKDSNLSAAEWLTPILIFVLMVSLLADMFRSTDRPIIKV